MKKYFKNTKSNVIKVVPLGAGRHVGRSCILVSLGNKNVMLDCGVHFGFKDRRMFPDFSYIRSPLVRYVNKSGPAKNTQKNQQPQPQQQLKFVNDRYTQAVDAVLITHFHLDHTGALPFFTERCGFTGPVVMTRPTMAITPLLLRDFQKISRNKFFSEEDIRKCFEKITAINLNESLFLGADGSLKVTCYYAGHVLGAVMYFVEDLETGHNFLYTGDYNMASNRHLGGASVRGLVGKNIQLLITETTYGDSIRDSRLYRERVFLKTVHDTLKNGGKVLIPVFALGRVQELSILIETYWERMNLKYPVYFSSGMIERANKIYKLFPNWMNQKIKKKFSEKRNMFDFRFIKLFDKNRMLNSVSPMVLFATPGMIHAGTSLEVFKRWSLDPKNSVVMPGYCVKGTIGYQILHAKNNIIKINDKAFTYKAKIKPISFSAHADSRGILTLIKQLLPKNIVFVHGEKRKMLQMGETVGKESLNTNLYYPENGETVLIDAGFPEIEVNLSRKLLGDTSFTNQEKRIKGFFVMKDNGETPMLLHPNEAAKELNLKPHKLKYSVSKRIKSKYWVKIENRLEELYNDTLKKEKNYFYINSVTLNRVNDNLVVVSWNDEDEEIGVNITKIIDKIY